MLHHIILSLTIFLSVLTTPVLQTMSWDFWTRNNYRNACIMTVGSLGIALLSHLLEGENLPQTDEKYCHEVSSMLDTLYFEYGPKIAVFEQAYKITAQDILTKNEQLEIARQQWHTQIDEEANIFLQRNGYDDSYFY